MVYASDVFVLAENMNSTQKRIGISLHISKGKGHLVTDRGGSRGSGQVKAPDFLDVRHYKGGRS